jgi:hypothetical protein
MSIEVHRVVQKPDDFNGATATDSAEHDVPRISTWQLDESQYPTLLVGRTVETV